MQYEFTNKLTVWLGGTAIFLVFVIVLQAIFPPVVKAGIGDPRDAAEVALPQFESVKLAPPSMAHLSDMMERPLFFSDRRMPVVPVATETADTSLNLNLVGVAAAGDSGVALLRDTTTNRLIQLGAGMSHNGWTLELIDANRAVFERNGETSELPLSVETNRRR